MKETTTVNKEIKEILTKFFENFPMVTPVDITMPQADFFLLHLWLRGLEIKPIIVSHIESYEIEDE